MARGPGIKSAPIDSKRLNESAETFLKLETKHKNSFCYHYCTGFDFTNKQKSLQLIHLKSVSHHNAIVKHKFNYEKMLADSSVCVEDVDLFSANQVLLGIKKIRDCD